MWWLRQHEHAICLPYEQKVGELIKKNNVKGFKKKRANANRGGQNDWDSNNDDQDRNDDKAQDNWNDDDKEEEEDDGAFGFSDDGEDDECTDWTKKAH